jgi:hypothetical protein
MTELPSDALDSAGDSILLSLSTFNSGFQRQWAAPFLIMGTYNKMVQQHGSDAAAARDSRAA